MSIERLFTRGLSLAINARPRKKRAKGEVGSDSLGIEIRPDGSHVSFDFPPELRLRHLHILGASGSGKTNIVSQLIEKDIKARRNVIILDMRGDLIDKALRFIVSHPELITSDRVDLIDLRHKEFSAGVNFFQSSLDPFAAALHMHEIIRSSAEGWGVQIDETVRSSLVCLSFARRTISELPRLLTDEHFRWEVLSQVSDEQTLGFFERFDALSPERRQTWVLPVLNKVSPLLSHPTIRAILGENEPINIPQVLSEPGRVLLCGLAADRLHGLAGTFGCLFVSAIENAAMQRVDLSEGERNPIHLYLDEFEHFASPAFESILAEGRRFGLGLTLSHQNLAQVDTRLRAAISNNAAVKVYFATGVTDGQALQKELKSRGLQDPIQTLLAQRPGEALVTGIGLRARRVRFRRAQPSEPDASEISSFLEDLRRRYRPAAPTVGARTHEVRHVRKPRVITEVEA